MPTLNNSVQQNGVVELANLFLSVTGGKVFYVGTSTSIANLGDAGAGIAGRLFTDVNTALGQCVAGRGDCIYVLPGYTENIAAADAWSGLGTATDVTIVGMGRGTNRPTFTWTTSGSTMLFDQANFKLLNCRLFLAGAHAAGAALTVAAPITVSAAGCEISNCEIFWGFDADQIVAIGITTTAAADQFSFNDNYCYAETAAVPTTTFLRLVGADYLKIYNTKIVGPGSTTAVAPVQFLTTASLGIDLRNSIFQHTLASSAAAITGMAGLTGTAYACAFGMLNDSGLVGFVTPASVQLFLCQVSNLAGEGGGFQTPVST